ncbi:uncharacterized protein V6R79_000355 [Siganus canaliculatus]
MNAPCVGEGGLRGRTALQATGTIGLHFASTDGEDAFTVPCMSIRRSGTAEELRAAAGESPAGDGHVVALVTRCQLGVSAQVAH